MQHRALLLLGGAIGALWLWNRQKAAIPAGASPATGQPKIAYVASALNPCQGCGGKSGLMQWVSPTAVQIASPFGAGLGGPTGQWQCVCGG